jgi:hypothetical protein
MKTEDGVNTNLLLEGNTLGGKVTGDDLIADFIFFSFFVIVFGFFLGSFAATEVDDEFEATADC